MSIVPLPRSLGVAPGAYLWHRTIRISARTAGERTAAAALRRYLQSLGLRATIVRAEHVPVDAALQLAPAHADNGAARLGSEGYRLSVSQRGVVLVANTAVGLFYGVQTLEQASALQPDAGFATRHVQIVDWPAYAWRGIHLDVSRHFFGPRTIERYIDVAAHYKLNTLHWHLTDDQAWRIAIKRYPRLTRAARCRGGTCEFYTQADVRHIVAYAAERGMRVVPEIDVPGHSGAALAAYPEYGCAPGARRYVLCPTNASVTFVENVLREVLELFPGAYVHIGGDEVDTSEWQGSDAVARIMRREHLNSLTQVANNFSGRIAHFLRARGRRPVVWDDLAPDAARDVTVMLWQPHHAGGVLAARRDVVATPDGPLYFDAYQGDPSQEPPAFGGPTTLRDVYAYDPAPLGTSVARRAHVLGAQANVWTERIVTERHLFYMLLPRELALSEIVWTRSKDRSWNSFERRLPTQFAWLSRHGYAFRIPDAACVVTRDGPLAARSTHVALSAPLDANIRYTTDGSLPRRTSRAYRAPLRVDGAGAPAVRARVFTRDGRQGSVSTCGEGSGNAK